MTDVHNYIMTWIETHEGITHEFQRFELIQCDLDSNESIQNPHYRLGRIIGNNGFNGIQITKAHLYEIGVDLNE